MAGRILVIRGGAIGDFILTLPAIGLLRENFPACHLEILGYRHICALADQRYYANATRSIEYGPMAGFFNPRADQDAGLAEYFRSFNQVVSYIYDPDELFATCLKRAGVKNLIAASPIIEDGSHAACQLAQPLERLALFLGDPSAKIHLTQNDHAEAERLLGSLPKPLVAIHPGSGGKAKNWPVERWVELLETLRKDRRIGHVLVIGGESDSKQLDDFRRLSPGGHTLLENLPLCTLGAILAKSALFLGHDSGISHLAAAAGAACLLLFGPTDPDIWAPAGSRVHILRAPDGDLTALEFRDVAAKLNDLLAHV